MNKLLPPTYFMIALLLTAAAHFLFRYGDFLAFPWTLTGILPIVVGSWFNLAADQLFKKRNTTVKPFEESSVLVTDGVFRVTRNPMYVGMILILLGEALLLGSIAPFLVVLVAAVFFDRTYIVPEECQLAATFGEEFDTYRSRVRRWL
ncbi:MAG: isoprenylcysteine carboxylmethyltransferase family protein [Bacteroidetes bacterium]|nr:isoprenylcysteine carboxylmethyltransferase family protein [Bacteroidota bacterium]